MRKHINVLMLFMAMMGSCQAESISADICLDSDYSFGNVYEYAIEHRHEGGGGRNMHHIANIEELKSGCKEVRSDEYLAKKALQELFESSFDARSGFRWLSCYLTNSEPSGVLMDLGKEVVVLTVAKNLMWLLKGTSLIKDIAETDACHEKKNVEDAKTNISKMATPGIQTLGVFLTGACNLNYHPSLSSSDSPENILAYWLAQVRTNCTSKPGDMVNTDEEWESLTQQVMEEREKINLSKVKAYIIGSQATGKGYLFGGYNLAGRCPQRDVDTTYGIGNIRFECHTDSRQSFEVRLDVRGSPVAEKDKIASFSKRSISYLKSYLSDFAKVKSNMKSSCLHRLNNQIGTHIPVVRQALWIESSLSEDYLVTKFTCIASGHQFCKAQYTSGPDGYLSQDLNTCQ